jgi:hypothetical protein
MQQPRHQASIDSDDVSVLDNQGRRRAICLMRQAFLAAEIPRTEACDEAFVTFLRHDCPVKPAGGDIEDRVCRVALPEKASACGIFDVRKLNAKLLQTCLRVGVMI